MAISPRFDEIKEALREVEDPEIGMSVVDLGLIREIDEEDDGSTHVKMLLTTPFCPAAGWIVDQVKQATNRITGTDTQVTLLDELWDPSMMEVDPWGLF
ncbi:MAG: metal-sulfur cluster assembly factor [Chloroflexi bacterium]|nr:metal-sulfur cluster assembly factor [Chloroflexota bacterium]